MATPNPNSAWTRPSWTVANSRGFDKPLLSKPLNDVPHRTRVSHKKSRLGCVECKRRRVKCDEAKPVCAGCRRRGVPCIVQSGDQRPLNSNTISGMANRIRAILPAPSQHILEASMIKSSLAGGVTTPKNTETMFTTSDLEHLRHFETFTAGTIGDLKTQIVYSSDVLRSAVHHPPLMHAVLAMSVLHTRFLKAGSPASLPASPYFTYHWQQCLTKYSQYIASSISEHNADALLITSTLINGIAFLVLDDDKPETAWPGSAHPRSLHWLSIQGGINLIFRETQGFVSSSKIKDLFAGEEDFVPPELTAPDLVHLMPALSKLCDITMTSNVQNNIYLGALVQLAPLMQIPCGSDTIFFHLGFIASLSPGFVSLLAQRDHRALLILSFWYAVVCPYDCWWVNIRSRNECASICRYLQRYADEQVLSLLTFPASACMVDLATKPSFTRTPGHRYREVQ